MALIHAGFCKQCGRRRTKHASGLCCDCRKKAGYAVTRKMSCKLCGKQCADQKDGLCDNCRKKMAAYVENEKKRRELVLRELKLNETIIQLYDDGASFDKIAGIVGLAKTAVYRRYRMLVPKKGYFEDAIV